eukprot:GILJ01000064.1.p1 GENE.GILJ01000064.1~~GILJ01000064.1.p1  ORF type:complete len:384 (-),score=96.09 GILJ01000064.1:160-1311(-)
MQNDQYVSFLGGENRPKTNTKKKIILASLAAIGVVGVVAACVLLATSSGSSASSTNLVSAPATLTDASYEKLGLLTEEHYTFLFDAWKKEHGKTYAHAQEHTERYLVFKSNLDYIKKHNEDGHSYRLALNQFADMTKDEFRVKHLGLSAKPPGFKSSAFSFVDAASLPASVDWRSKNAVTPVKNQQQCGSCWAFSATGALEGLAALTTGKLQSFSEQQLVDCSAAQGNDGCNGGLMDQAFKFVMDNGGIALEGDYKYTAADGTCNKKVKNAFDIKGFTDVPVNDEDALTAAIAQQPVAVAIEADQMSFQFYSSGVFDGSCGTNLDHGVLAVGYGTDSGKDYYIVKNSWGATWGDKGYIKLVRHAGGKSAGQCGIAMSASYPTA